MRSGRSIGLLTALAACLISAAQSPMPELFWQGNADFKGASVAYCVMDAGSGEIVLEHNKDLSLIPASTLKIFTTGAALVLLGSDYRFETTIAYSGSFDSISGTLNGDLLIVGGGDPSLGSTHAGKHDLCAEWADLLKKTGLKNISGCVKGVSSWKRVVPDQWIWCDVSNYYAAAPSALSYRDNKFSINFRGGASGTKAEIAGTGINYASKTFSFDCDVVCEGYQDKAFVYGDPFGYKRSIRGSIPANKERFSIEAALPDPALLLAEELNSALSRAGILSKNEPTSEYTTNFRVSGIFFKHRSAPLSDLVKITNQHSNNLYCESMVFAIGKGQHQNGLKQIADYWNKKGIGNTAYFPSDGSGLARASTCSAEAQCNALFSIRSVPEVYQVIDASLPIAGKQGSMKSVGKGTFIENNLRAKTGYIERVRAYCGYLTDKSGRDLIFSVLLNNYTCSPTEARKVAEKLMVSFCSLKTSEE